MANNLTTVIPQILALALPVLRQNAIMPRLVAREPYETEAANKGQVIEVPVTAALPTQDVSPAPYAPATDDIVTTNVLVPLDQWKEAAFYMTDKDLVAIANGFLPRQAEEAVKSLGNTVDNFILGELAKGVPYSVGTPGTTPFGTDLAEATAARAQLNRKLAPLGSRYVVLDPEAEGNALLLRAFQDASFRGDTEGIIEGSIGRKLGSEWTMDQNVVARAQGTGTAYELSANVAKGANQFPVDTGTGTLLPGDVFTVAGDSEPYSVVAFSGGIITVSPGARVALSSNALLTPVASNGVVNWNLQRDSFAFANRAFAGDGLARQAGAVFESITDPITGLSIRLELTREHKRVRWSFDMLYGGKVVRPELAVRIYG